MVCSSIHEIALRKPNPESAPLRHLGPLADLPLVVLEHQRRLDHVGEPALTSAGRRTSMHLSSEKTRSADAELGNLGA